VQEKETVISSMKRYIERRKTDEKQRQTFCPARNTRARDSKFASRPAKPHISLFESTTSSVKCSNDAQVRNGSVAALMRRHRLTTLGNSACPTTLPLLTCASSKHFALDIDDSDNEICGVGQIANLESLALVFLAGQKV
jgi:hypothetical protein